MSVFGFERQTAQCDCCGAGASVGLPIVGQQRSAWNHMFQIDSKTQRPL